MSIQSEIERISTNVQNTINTIADTGVAVASDANSDDLPALAAALANEKADKSHTHSYLPLSGGNVSGHIYMTGAKESSSTSNTSQLVFGTSSNNHIAVTSNNNALVLNPTTASTTNQIVLYLDKASIFPKGISGNASSATKLGTSGGSATQPVYFSDGKPAACTYSLGASVPSGAVFTDTKNTAGSTNSSSKLFLVGATSQAANPQTYSHDTAYVGTDGYLYSNSEKVNPRIYTTLVPEGTEITANTNLNTVALMKVGNYYCSANTTVATLTNCPTTSAFMMQVYSPLSTTIDNETTKTWVYRLRKMMVYTGEEYIQYCYAGSTAGTWTYGDWKKIIKATDTATTSAAGVMSAADKTKLDGIATGANKYTLPTASSSTLGGVKTTSTVTSTTGLTPCPIISGVPYYAESSGGSSTKTTTVTANIYLNANTESYVTIDYSGVSGTVLLSFFCGVTATNSSSAVTKAVPTYGQLGKVDRVRLISTTAQSVNVCIGVIYR